MPTSAEPVPAEAALLMAGPNSLGGIMVAWRSIWFPIGRGSDGEPVYVPTSEPHMVASDGRLFHAVDTTLKVNHRRKTVDTVCGKRAYRFGLSAIKGCTILPIWPTPARWSEDRQRCPDCFAATGKRRPHVMYRGTIWRASDSGGADDHSVTPNGRGSTAADDTPTSRLKET